MFDDKFVWGVASSAYQVEGTDPDDGRGKTVWDTFTEQGRIFQNQNAYTSCDHMHHYKDDYALMKNLGIKAYRFSLNWRGFCRRAPGVSMKKRLRCTAT